MIATTREISLERYWHRIDVAKKAGVDIRTIDNWCKHEGLPFMKVGKKVLFDPVEVEAFFQSRKESR